MALLGGGKFFPWGDNCPPRYIVKKGTVAVSQQPNQTTKPWQAREFVILFQFIITKVVLQIQYTLSVCHKAVYSLPWELHAYAWSIWHGRQNRSVYKITHWLPVKSLSSINLQNSRQE
jgi:hypothetical protein